MYKFEYRTANGSYCVKYDEKLKRTIAQIERKGGTVLAIKRLEVAI